MIFKPLASGSKGNCYYIKSGNTSGLIEVGIPWKSIKRKLNFKTSELDFVAPLHRHRDHSGHLKDAVKNGINVFAIQDVWDSVNIFNHRCHVIEPLKQFKIKGLTFLPFSIPHDVPNIGLLISDGKDKLLYLSDLGYSPYTFHGVTILAIEVNYQLKILNENVKQGFIPLPMKNRILNSHFSLKNVLGFIENLDLSHLKEIWALHLSDSNSNEKQIKKALQGVTGKPVYLAGENGGFK